MKAKDLKQDSNNYRKHSDTNKKRIKKSIDENGLGRSVLVDADGVLIAGNGVASVVDKDTKVRVVETDGTELVVVKRTDLHEGDARRKALALADNATSDSVEWDFDAIEADGWDKAQLSEDWGVEWAQYEEEDDDEVRRKEREFAERMEAGEDLSEDEDYLAFLDKFKGKKTTDDCYTPDVVYDAVLAWCVDAYKIEKKDVVRPFYPNGDYQKEDYPDGCVVVDNPPFSILAEILKFYTERGIRFFLFAPALTLFSSSSSKVTALSCGVTVTYENGANVNTSFLTNLEDPAIRFKSCPTLYEAVTRANDENLRATRRELPKYTYPDNVVTASFVARLSKYGIDFKVGVKASAVVSQLESQKAAKKAIYGKGYIIGNKAAAEKAAAEKVAAEKAAAEKAAAEKAAATRWSLSSAELQLIETLSKNEQ